MSDRNESAAEQPAPTARGWSRRLGLSGKLLALTACAIMLAEVVFYVPSVASYRYAWLNDRLQAAQTAALVFRATTDEVSPELQQQILRSIGARMLAMRIEHRRLMLANTNTAIKAQIRQDIDTRAISTPHSIIGALDTLLLSKDSDIIRVVGPAPTGGDFLEVVLDEGPLRRGVLGVLREKPGSSRVILTLPGFLVLSCSVSLFLCA